MLRESGEPAATFLNDVTMRKDRRVGLPGVAVAGGGKDLEEKLVVEVNGEEQSA